MCGRLDLRGFIARVRREGGGFRVQRACTNFLIVGQREIGMPTVMILRHVGQRLSYLAARNVL